MEARCIITNEHLVAMLTQYNREKLSMPDLHPSEVVALYHELLQQYAFIIEHIQKGDLSLDSRDPDEDPKEVLAELRKYYKYESVSGYILRMENIISFSKILDDFRFVCNNIKIAK